MAAYRALPGAHLSSDYAAELADVGRQSVEAEVLVAVDGDLVGCVTFVPDASSPWAELLEEGEAWIHMLAILPTAQGRGVGRALLEACISGLTPKSVRQSTRRIRLTSRKRTIRGRRAHW